MSEKIYQIIAEGSQASVVGVFSSIDDAKEKAIEMSTKNGKRYFITESIAVVETNVNHTFNRI